MRKFIKILIASLLLMACQKESEPQSLTPQLFVNEVQQLGSNKYFLSGSYDPVGKEIVSKAVFYYGTTEAMEQSITANLSGITATVILEGLDVGTTYYYCLEIGNGADSRRSDMHSFTTEGTQLTGLVMKNTKFINVLEQQLGRDFQKEANGTVSLDIEYNQRMVEMVTTLDLSDMGDPKITNEIYFLPNLKVLSCGGNGITALNLMDNPLLEEVYCEGKEIRGINEWGNDDILGHDGVLSSILLVKNKALRKLYVGGNKLTRLDLSACPALEELSCFEDSIKTLDVTNMPSLKKLECYRCNLSTLDVTKNTQLTYLECYSNQLTSLDVSHNPVLKHLFCSWQSIKHLDLTHNLDLEWLNCHYIDATEFDLSKNTKLICAYFWGNPLGTIDLTYNTNLEELDLNYCNISELNLSNNTKLKRLSIQGNNFTSLESLDLASKNNFEYLNCILNHIEVLDISNTHINMDSLFGCQKDINGSALVMTLYVNSEQYNQEMNHEHWNDIDDVNANIKLVVKYKNT